MSWNSQNSTCVLRMRASYSLQTISMKKWGCSLRSRNRPVFGVWYFSYSLWWSSTHHSSSSRAGLDISTGEGLRWDVWQSWGRTPIQASGQFCFLLLFPGVPSLSHSGVWQDQLQGTSWALSSLGVCGDCGCKWICTMVSPGSPLWKSFGTCNWPWRYKNWNLKIANTLGY